MAPAIEIFRHVTTLGMLARNACAASRTFLQHGYLPISPIDSAIPEAARGSVSVIRGTGALAAGTLSTHRCSGALRDLITAEYITI